MKLSTLFNIKKVMYILLTEKLAALFPDKLYLQLKWWFIMGTKLNVKYPKTFNEKMQWLKLNMRRDDFTLMVDKVEAKEFVRKVLGPEYIIPTINVWSTVEDVDFRSLPSQFVIKTTNDSGGVVVCYDKSKLDVDKVKLKLYKSWKTNYFNENREYPYKNIIPRVFAEELLDDGSSHALMDYKFMCYNGRCENIFVCSNRDKSLQVDFFDREWKHLPFQRHYPNAPYDITKPEALTEMLDAADRLSTVISHPFVRIDFYYVKGHVYFGEITFFPGSGMEEFTPPEWDGVLGKMIKLPIDE